MNRLGIINAVHFWDSVEALLLLKTIVKQQVPEHFNLKLLNSLVDREFNESAITINLISNNSSDKLFEAFANLNF